MQELKDILKATRQERDEEKNIAQTLQDKLEEFGSELANSNAEVANWKSKILEMEEQLKESDHRLETVQQQLDIYMRGNASLIADLETQKDIAHIETNDKNTLKKQLDEHAEKIKSLDEKTTVQAKENLELQRKLDDMKIRRQRFVKKLKGLFRKPVSMGKS